MARTPSMSVAECESALGARGGLVVSDANRRLVRKWLTAQGLPALFVGGLSMRELAFAYNDTTGDAIDKLRRKLNETSEDSPAETTSEVARSGHEEVMEARAEIASNLTDGTPVSQAASVARNAVNVDSVARSLADLLARGGVDQESVSRIVDEKLAAFTDAFQTALPGMIQHHSTITRIEITRQDGSVHQVEGHSHPKLKTLIRAMASRQANGRHPNIMIVGPTGSGKTHGFEQACKAIGLPWYANGAISMDHQLIGFKDAAGNYHKTPLRQAFGQPAGYLFDEIDSSDNSPLLALAGALANSGFEFPDAFVDRHPDSVIVAAANTWGLGATADFVGRNKLDGAIRSRFPVRIYWDYDEILERAICGNQQWAERVQRARAKARAAGLKVIIDPRMSQAGAALIAEGMSENEAASLTYLADLSQQQREIVEAV